jgi:long-chain acyl-CoA synthetase
MTAAKPELEAKKMRPVARSHLATLLEDFEKHGRETAVVTHRGVRRVATTYAELTALANRFAAELMRREIRFGDRVVLWGANSAEWIAAFFGCMQRGVIAVPLDAAGSVAFAERVMREVQPRLVVGDASLLAALAKSGVATLPFEAVEAELPAATGPLVDAALRPDTPLQIIFTSGTTAEPKGVVHTHRNILASLDPIEREMRKYLRYERYFHPLRFLHTLPLSHVFGQFMGVWIPALLAAEVHFDTRLQAQHLIETIHGERISVLVAVPRVLELLRVHLLERDPGLEAKLQASRGVRVWVPWWRFRRIHSLFGYKFWAFVCGGASLPEDLEQFWNTIGLALIQGYGMTESSALITLNHPFKIGRGTIGKVLPGRDVRISEDGEILVRGEMISGATWQQGRLHPNPSEWLATGDLARKDETGSLRFVGRKNQVIVTAAGLNVYPEDVEAALNRQPGVAASAVVPREIPSGTEPAAVLLFHGTREEAQQAVMAANAELAEYQRIRYWKLWPELDLPRTSTGKVQRRTLAEWVHPKLEENGAQTAAADPLARMILEITGAQPGDIGDATRLDEELGLDSLGRVQLQGQLEQRLGVSFEDAVFQQAATLGELRHSLGMDRAAATSRATVAPADAVSSGATTADGRDQAAKPRGRKGAAIYPRWPWSWPARAVRYGFIEGVLRPMVWLLAAPKVAAPKLAAPEIDRPDGLEARTPLLVIATHVSAYDVALILYALPSALRRRVAVAMAANLLSDWRQRRGSDLWLPSVTGPLTYWLVTLLFNVFPLPRSAGFRRSFEHAGEALDHGFQVLVFPEGRRTGGTLADFRPGIGLLVQQTRAAVLPVGLAGLEEVTQGRKHWFRSGAVTVRVGTPLRFEPDASAEQITERLHAAVAALLI